MDITGKIKRIKYKKALEKNLTKFNLKNFDINSSPSSSLIFDGQNLFAISKWVSPKRTRSYPYARIYDTIHISKKITVITVMKDEGKSGDRDFLQWDTVSMMSLLDIYVIFAYYSDAKKLENKIAEQKFDNDYIIPKIKEIEDYHSSALHWNLKELTDLHFIADKIKYSYLRIEKKTGVKLHGFKGIDVFRNKISKNIKDFVEFSREKARKAQVREYKTIQPKESLNTLSKAKITISNYLGGKYFFTVDEVVLNKNIVKLVESKHSRNSVLPGASDIKDGLVKMILYSNLCSVEINGISVKSKSVLRLTSAVFIGAVSSKSVQKDVDNCFKTNSLSEKQKEFVERIFKEAEKNDFIVQIEGIK
ncbi:MAG: hypothetical protein Ta2C_10080 [Candidatus Endomicrobiellum trichonymphae]|uniref:hypothetical protein n=1 Tax=Endomicrobium trichonymphae TaxID=1408204 RepID=UPI0027D3BFB0|nr:MAG: hypothetical protein Ta2C_10080 [Candidatus Endomicrobium trichonymphae]